MRKLAEIIIDQIDSSLEFKDYDGTSFYEITSSLVKRKYPKFSDLITANGALAPTNLPFKQQLNKLASEYKVLKRIEKKLFQYRYKEYKLNDYTSNSVKNKQRILLSLMGEMANMKADKRDFFYKSNLMRSFILGGTQIKVLSSDLDEIRRRACREFIFQ